MGLSDHISPEGLSSCPNCGAGPDQIMMVDRLHRPHGFPVTKDNENDRELFCRCTSCGFETAPGITGYNALTKHTTSVDKAREIAIGRWQRQETRYVIRERLFARYPDQEEYQRERSELIRQGRMQPWD